MKKLLIATLTCVVFLSGATAASAEIRTGTVTDPTGDSPVPGGDVVSASASYDTNGSLTVNATTAGAPSGFFSFSVASVSGTSCLGVTGSLFGTVPGTTSVFTLTGVRGVGDARQYVSGNTVSMTTTAPATAGKDWSCMTLVVSDGQTPVTILDQLTLYFAGYEPDSDGDGIKDPSDKCPTVAAPGTADGCTPPAPVATPAPTPTNAPKSTKKKTTKVPAKCKKLKGKKRTACIKKAAKKQ